MSDLVTALDVAAVAVAVDLTAVAVTVAASMLADVARFAAARWTR